jgi:hypothetical protein
MQELQIADRQDIADVIVRYATALDTHDAELLLSCFTADARLQLDRAPVSSPAEFAERAKRLRTLAAVQHFITNIAVELAGHRATARSYGLIMQAHGETEGRKTLLTGGIYEDELAKTATGWQISRRRFTSLWAVEGTDVVTPTHDRLPVGA